MTTLDLRPLDQETIDKIGLEKHDLWLVKIRDELFGPFETQSLKQYSSENQDQFDEALTTRMDQIDYKPFWENPLFQRRTLQTVSEKHDGPYWLLNNGVKAGPYQFADIDKKIEMGLLVMTDYISTDDGHNWKKICELQCFDRRTHSPEELPAVPVEEVFHKGKLELVEKVENSKESAVDHLANLAHVGNISQEAKVIPFQAEEVALNSSSHAEAHPAAKWVVPVAATVVIALLSTGYLFLGDHEEAALVTETELPQKTEMPRHRMNARHAPRGEMPSMDRMPASASYAQRPNPDMYPRPQESRYPTHVETHERPYEEVLPERELDRPVAESEGRQPEQEHSLVAGNGNTNPNPNQNNVLPEETSLDDAMNGTERPAPEQQERPVEEASDF